ncbi:MAG: hypothetical protein DIU78_012125 [Pseudomonadota bacterium]
MKLGTTSTHTALLLTTLSLLSAGCTIRQPSDDDVSEYREALPKADHVRVAGPETQGTEKAQTAYGAADAGLLADAREPEVDVAQWYSFTRNVRDGVNVVTGVILGSLWLVVHTRPSEVGSDYAVWGPYTDALDPVARRLRVERVAEDEYEYRLEGRPKSSDSEDDYRTILFGKGYGRPHDEHGDGFFTIDLDVARALDPGRHAKDSGTITITHDLTRSPDRRLRALPRTIVAEIDPKGESFLTIHSTAAEDGSGEIEIDARADTDASGTTALEDLAMHGRYRADGAGRADVTVANGDVPAGIGAVTLTECWGTDFTRVYYSDSIELHPTEGDATACAF